MKLWSVGQIPGFLTLKAQVHIFEELVIHVIARTSAILALVDAVAREHLGAKDSFVSLIPTYLPVQGHQLVLYVWIVGGLFLGAHQVLSGIWAISCRM